MKNTFCIVTLVLGIGCGQQLTKVESKEDLAAFQEELRTKVADGQLSREEAIVSLAVAKKGLKGQGRKKTPKKLEAFGKDLKERVSKGEISAEDAIAKWEEASKRLNSAKDNDSTDNKKK